MTGHLHHPRDPRQAVCGLPADTVARWETEDPPVAERSCEDCLTLLPDAARPDDYTHPASDATLLESLRRIVAARQHAKIDGVLVDLWSARVTCAIWDRHSDEHRQRLLTLPSHELILRCVAIYTRVTGGSR
ncbi:hypothetical protein ACIBTV_31180 [Micromonospora sp. NPDC049366]|uniref:hypothetical protein n=1 Tax=Micromonospora sp. NPDC049366 TaxID=3364271 RepID=UPI0037B0623F